MGESVRESFRLVRDPRVERTRKHELLDILVIAIGSVICGAESRDETEELGPSNEDWFKTLRGPPHGIPRHDPKGRALRGTCGRVFAALDPDEFEAAFDEDDSQTRVGNAAGRLSRVRRITLMLLKREKTAKLGVEARRKKAGRDRSYLLEVLQRNRMRRPCRSTSSPRPRL